MPAQSNEIAKTGGQVLHIKWHQDGSVPSSIYSAVAAADLGLEGSRVSRAGVGYGLGDQILVVLRVMAVVAHACVTAVVPCAMSESIHRSRGQLNKLWECASDRGQSPTSISASGNFSLSGKPKEFVYLRPIWLRCHSEQQQAQRGPNLRRSSRSRA